ncbi:MAG: hypothetical protein JNM58_07080 [Xanthomonadaceae bacterium]|nr:hypothetical protein [Xanthomonadaceae bacterium]
MRSFLFCALAVCLLPAIALAGYFSSRPETNRVRPLAERRTGTYDISFERTGCYGTCPVYVLRVDAEGHSHLILTGFDESDEGDENEFRPVEVHYQWKLPAIQHARILETFEKRGFRRLKRNYWFGVTDHETRIISLSTPHGRWSTTVYAVPCERDAGKWNSKPRAKSGMQRPVPDVFCDAADLLHTAACDTLAHGASVPGRSQPERIRLFHPPRCDQ